MMKKILEATCVGMKNYVESFIKTLIWLIPVFLWLFYFGCTALIVIIAFLKMFPEFSEEMNHMKGIAMLAAVAGALVASFLSTFFSRVKRTIKLSDETGKSLEEAWKETGIDWYDGF